MATLSRRHPCARPSFCRRSSNAFRALIEEGLREYEEERRTEKEEKKARARMRSLREVYAFHLEMLAAVFAREQSGWTYGITHAVFGHGLRVRPTRGAERGRGTSRMPEA